jgi:hypothetical protein
MLVLVVSLHERSTYCFPIIDLAAHRPYIRRTSICAANSRALIFSAPGICFTKSILILKTNEEKHA